MNWEETFQSWAKGPSRTEQEKCENAESVICDALNNDKQLSQMDITVFTQGSYKARTNISQDSDVDICILLKNHIFVDYPDNFTNENSGLSYVELSYAKFKNLVEGALVKKFGRQQVVRGKKAFDIHENTYRIAADVVPVFEHRRYTGKYDHKGSPIYLSGIEFQPDNGGRVINWPDQTYSKGVAKNDVTARRYKRIIRILKRLRNKMQEEKIAAANNIASFLIESLVWNTPDEGFNHSSYRDDVRYVLMHTFNHTLSDDPCNEWGEVNELKYLFRPSQPWTRQQAHDFLSAAWDYLGFQ
jgi:hypothetical protein